jgi:hypothetical protein
VVWCRDGWQCWFWFDLIRQKGFCSYSSDSPYHSLARWDDDLHASDTKGWDPDLRALLMYVGSREHARVLRPMFEPETVYGPERRWVPSVWRRSQLSALPPPLAESGAALTRLKELGEWDEPD